MRTTVTLDSDVHLLVQRYMRQRSIPFKQAVNEAIRNGLTEGRERPADKTPTFSIGFNPALDLDRALTLAADLEDREIARKLDARK